MIEEAKHNAARAGVPVRFEVADSDCFEVAEPYDAVISFMSAFFTYSENPVRFVELVMPFVRKKILLDWNFRSPGTFVEAAQIMKSAGFQQIEWRPWFIPHSTVSASVSRRRSWLEGRPNLALLLLILKRWHYTISLKGESQKAATGKNNPGQGELRGHRIPVSLVQRLLIKFGQITR